MFLSAAKNGRRGRVSLFQFALTTGLKTFSCHDAKRERRSGRAGERRHAARRRRQWRRWGRRWRPRSKADGDGGDDLGVSSSDPDHRHRHRHRHEQQEAPPFFLLSPPPAAVDRRGLQALVPLDLRRPGHAGPLPQPGLSEGGRDLEGAARRGVCGEAVALRREFGLFFFFFFFFLYLLCLLFSRALSREREREKGGASKMCVCLSLLSSPFSLEVERERERKEKTHSSLFLVSLNPPSFFQTTKPKPKNAGHGEPLGPLGRRHGQPRPDSDLRLLRRGPPPLLPPLRPRLPPDFGGGLADGGAGIPGQHHSGRGRDRLGDQRGELRPDQAVWRRGLGALLPRGRVAGAEKGVGGRVRRKRPRVGQRAAADADASRLGAFVFVFFFFFFFFFF